MTIIEIKNYFIDRSDEIISLSLRGDPWIFLCGAAMIDYLTHMTEGYSRKAKYIKFVKDYFSRVDSRYKDFEYQNGIRPKDLPEQMYTILRCGIVHSFSFVPNPRGISNGGRERSILLAHEKNGYNHFDPYTKDGMDSVIFTAEKFSRDIQSVVKIIFKDVES